MKLSRNFKHGDVLHCRRKNLLSRLIRFATRSQFSHTAMIVIMNDQIFVADSQADGTNLRTYQNWMNKYQYEFIVSREIDLPYDEMISALRDDRLKSIVGVTGYDFLSLFWYQPRYIISGKWRGKRKDEAKDRMFCSEFVAYVIGMPNWWKASPQALFNYIDTNDKWVHTPVWENKSYHYDLLGSMKGGDGGL